MTRSKIQMRTCHDCLGKSRPITQSVPPGGPDWCKTCLGLGFLVWKTEARPEPMTEEELVRQICLKHAKKTGKNQGWQLYRLSRHHESRPPNSEPTTHEAFGVTVRVTPAVKIVFMVSAVCVVCDQVIWSGQEIHGLRVELETIVRREGHEDMTMREGGELARFHATQCLLKWWSEQE